MNYLPPDLWLVCTIFATFFGACVGSFLNVCIYRIPLDQSVVAPRSHCMTCGSLIPWYHNIPVFSYFILRGKCFKCGAAFSFRYAAVELFTAFMFMLACVAFPPNGRAFLGITPLPSMMCVPILWVFISGLIIATFVDFDHFIIPDSISIGGIFVGLVFSALVPEMHLQAAWHKGLAQSALGAVAGFGLLWSIGGVGKLIFRKEAMGFGDVKLMGAIGAFWGWQAVLFTLVAAALLGTVVGITLILLRKSRLGARLPFGPYISLGAVVCVFWGHSIIDWYLGFFAPAELALF